MTSRVFKSTCITTNFDKLLERAFAIQGKMECQPIRLDDEAKYWQEGPNKCYVLKRHGDCDTYNVANTHEETLRISPKMRTHVAALARSSGLLVIGTAGNERSIQNMFDELEEQMDGTGSVLDYGVLWGIHCGPKPTTLPSESEIRQLVRSKLNDGVNAHIARMMERASRKRSLFVSFPLWGADRFMQDLIADVSDISEEPPVRSLPQQAKRYLDHDARLACVFADLDSDALKNHLDKLREQRKRIEKLEEQPDWPFELLLTAKSQTKVKKEVYVLHGDTTSQAVLECESHDLDRRAVVSPDDTCVSAGGGVAYRLAKRAGLFAVLNELDKIGKIKLGEVAVTSAGELPVEYISHAAAGEVQKNGKYSCSLATVGDAIDHALQQASALRVNGLWTPLLAAGTGGLSPKSSLREICKRIHKSLDAKGKRIMIVIFQRDLDRSEAVNAVRRNLSSWSFNTP